MESLYMTSPETQETIRGKIQGRIPDWINGNLYRNGPGAFDVGETQYQHWFDGLGLLHKFEISKGEVKYRSKYIRSETYKKNMKADRIVVSEFGTAAFPDPCKNIFQRMSTSFQTDNTLVTVTPLRDYVYTASETKVIHKVDPETLDTISAHNIEKFVVVNVASAHILLDQDSTMHNLGNCYRGIPNYSIIKIPASQDGEDVFKKAEVVGSVPFRWPNSPSYLHSFGMSDNYYVFLEQPLCINTADLMETVFTRKTFVDCLKWHEGTKTLFHILDKRTGQKVNPKMTYLAEPFFVFHHINAYEEDGNLVVDVSAYEDPEILYIHYLKNLRSEQREIYPEPTVRRYVLPLDASVGVTSGGNLVTLTGSSATAVKQNIETIMCNHETLSDIGLDFPQVNEGRRGKKYRYIFGAGGPYIDKLVKIDTVTKQSLVWQEEGTYVSEPVFVCRPGATDEDDGAVLAVLYKMTKPRHVTSLLVLDAKTMMESGRAQFKVPLPRDIHGSFLSHK